MFQNVPFENTITSHPNDVGSHLSTVSCHKTHVERHLSTVGRHKTNVGRHLSPVGRHKTNVGRHSSPVGYHKSYVGRHLSTVGCYKTHVAFPEIFFGSKNITLKKSFNMGLVYADIELINAVDLANAKRNIIGEDEVKRMHLNMLVNSRAYMMAIN